jgi:hypothetical protein
MSMQEPDDYSKRGRYSWRKSPRDRVTLLAEIKGLSDDDYVSAAHASAFLDTSVMTLANWRSLRRGPRYEGGRGFIRYRLGELKRFMASRNNLPWDAA